MSSSGVSLLDVACLSVLLAVGGALAAPAMARSRTQARGGSEQMQLRQIYLGFMQHALTDGGKFPTPSRIDAAHATVPTPPNQTINKNTTGNLISFMIFSGYVSPEMVVSPAEVNNAVEVDRHYELDRPSRAADPDHALWDPGFAGTPVDASPQRRPPSTDVATGNQSYAHTVLVGRRLRESWTMHWSERKPVIGNRGPWYQGTTYPANGRWQLAHGAGGTLSNTLRFYGDPSRWDGFTMLNDGVVRYFNVPNPDISLFRYRRFGTPLFVTDNMFVNEVDNAGGDSGTSVAFGSNAFLKCVSNILGNGQAFQYWQD